MKISRRQFFGQTARFGSGAIFAPSIVGLTAWSKEACGRTPAPATGDGYGELIQSPEAPELWIPRGFRCIRISETGKPSAADPSFIVPNAIDGMAAFPLPNGNVRLIRNHELGDEAARARPIGQRPYDGKGAGGTTSLEVRVQGDGDDRRVEVVREFVSLSGTMTNCAGGPTPWGSWLTCEETVEGEAVIRHWNGTFGGREKKHGYVFEVPVSAEAEVEPVPLTAMGRFIHEAVAVDPDTGIVYLTEDTYYNPVRIQDQPGAGFYRFIPSQPGELARGGRLQMLAVQGRANYDTTRAQTAGRVLPALWVDIDDPDPANAEQDRHAVFRQGHAHGAAFFARLEGCWYGDSGIFFNSTSGGDLRAGQVWHYRPTSNDRGDLVLIFESPSRAVLNSPDNICASPRGGVVICEDAGGEQHIRGLSAEGEIFNLVHQPIVEGGRPVTEFAGSCFSPDGDVLFFNVQGSTRSYGAAPGATYAMWGPWETGPL